MAFDELDPLRRALSLHREGHPVALATVVETWGSAPRRAGSHMSIDGDGAFTGSVSGGCVETAVVDEALGALRDGRPRDLEYGVADEEAWAVGLACGGRVRVAVTPVGTDADQVDPRYLERALAALEGGSPVALLWNLVQGGVAPAEARHDLPQATVDAALRSDLGTVVETPAGSVFVRPYNPPVRIVVVGAVHIAQALVALARVAGFATLVVDPRTAFANPVRFPDAECVTEWPDVAFADIGLDARTAVVALTHDAKIDDPALSLALVSPAFYVGALGSRRTQEKRRRRLGDQGLSEAALDRLHAPIGLDLGGRAPEEIALSVLSEIVAVLRGGGVTRAS